jgi:hypothetical protein
MFYSCCSNYLYQLGEYMINIEGFIKVQRFIGSELLLIDDNPIAKKLQKLNGKQVILSINCMKSFPIHPKEWLKFFILKGHRPTKGHKVRNRFFYRRI